MAWEDSDQYRCPNCGHSRKRYLMSTDPDAPGLAGLLRGEGDWTMRMIAVAAILLAIFAIAFAIFANVPF